MASLPPADLRPQFSFSWETVRRLGRLARKELLEILRDRRTILTLVLMPVLLYPLMTVAFRSFIVASSIDPSKGQEYRFGLASPQEARFFERVLQSENKSLAPGQRQPILRILVGDLEEMVRTGVADVGIRFTNLPEPNMGKLADALVEGEVLFFPSSPAAQGALTFLEQVLAKRNLRLLERRLNVPGAEPRISVLKLRRQPLPETGAAGGVSLAALVPLILILMTITGAVYPAIDLTAGERERGTLEILVAAPVPRLGLLFAKYVTVLTVAVLTALINLVTMFLTLKLSGMSYLVFGSAGWPIALVAQMFGLLLLFAAFFSAVLLCLTSFARSFKEAQAYLIPLMLASLGPGLMGMMPGLKLEGALAATPLLNIVLLARDLFEGGADPLYGFLVVVSTLVYALAALALAAKVFGAEGVLYNEQSGWSGMLRRARIPRAEASAGAALWCLALMIPGNFLLQALWQSLGATVVGIGLSSVLLFVCLPGIGAFLERVRLVSGFALRRPSAAAVVGALILGLSVWPLVVEMMVHLHEPLTAMDEDKKEQIEAALRAIQKMVVPFAMAMGISALTEEWFFRGYLFTALARTTNAITTIVLTGVLFGVMHFLIGGGLGLEQLLPATFLGLMLGTIRWRTGSVIPGMVFHVCHNVLLALIGPQVKDWMSHDHVPALWLALGAAGSVVGALFIFWGGRTARPTALGSGLS